MWGLEIFNNFPKAQNHYNQDFHSMTIVTSKNNVSFKMLYFQFKKYVHLYEKICNMQSTR